MTGLVEPWTHSDPARYSSIGKKPQINLYTVTPKERDCRTHVPWDPAHPQYKDCSPNIEYVRYGCNHEYYRTSKVPGWTSSTIRARIKRGVSWGKQLTELCPRCWTNWSMTKLPRFTVPRKTLSRRLRPLEKLQRQKFQGRTLI